MSTDPHTPAPPFPGRRAPACVGRKLSAARLMAWAATVPVVFAALPGGVAVPELALASTVQPYTAPVTVDPSVLSAGGRATITVGQVRDAGTGAVVVAAGFVGYEQISLHTGEDSDTILCAQYVDDLTTVTCPLVIDPALAPGDYSIAVFLTTGDAQSANLPPSFSQIGSAPLTVLPGKAASTSTLSGYPAPLTSDGGTLSAKVAAATANKATPSGTVTFTDGGTQLCGGPVPLVQQEDLEMAATCATGATVPGPHHYVATYSGDAAFDGSTGTFDTTIAGTTPSPTPPVGTTTADLGVSLTHGGRFVRGAVAGYAVQVTNTGAVSTAGPTTVSVTLPQGTTFAGAYGPGWSCSRAGQTVTCRHAGSLAPRSRSGLALAVRISAPAGSTLTASGTLAPTDATPRDNVATDRVVVARR